MGIREILADRWSKAGKRSGSNEFKSLSTVDASITLLRDDGESLRASSEAIDGTEVQKFLGRSFEALVVPSFKSGIPDEDSISVIISAGKELSENDDFVRIVTKDMPVTGRGVSVGGPLVGLDLTFPAKVSSAGGFITGELFSNGHYYYCVVVLFIGKKQI